jgi:hypothetical protein
VVSKAKPKYTKDMNVFCQTPSKSLVKRQGVDFVFTPLQSCDIVTLTITINKNTKPFKSTSRQPLILNFSMQHYFNPTNEI